MIKFDMRKMIRDAIDDPKKARWSSELLDLFTGATLDSMWNELFQIDAYLTNQVDTLLTLTTPGYIDKRQTTDGDLSQRLYRVKSLVRNGREISEGNARNFVLEANVLMTGHDPSYFHVGDRIYITPLNTVDDVEISYSFRPAPYVDLEDNKDVVWPDGYDLAPIYETAGRLLAKGAAEDNEGYLALAAGEFGRLKSGIQRKSVGPIMILNADTDVGWGGT